MLSYKPSETFYAEQGLPRTTEVELAHETDFMYEFIALFVGEPISLWDLYKEVIKQPSREFEARLYIGNQLFDDDNIIEIVLDESVNSSDSLDLGSVVSSKLDITVYDKPGTNYTNATVTAEIGLRIDNEIAYLPLGVFTVDTVDKNKNEIKLTCFDNMHMLEKPYESNLTYPASLNQVALEIAQKANVTLTTSLPNIFVDEIKGYTLRQAIGFVASFVGSFAKFNRDGDLEIISYRETDEMITADNYIDLVTDENEFVVGQIKCKVDEETELVAGVGGTGITFENPIMTQTQLDAIFNDLKFMTYMPYEMKWQGNPMLLAGDKVTITDINDQIYTTLVMDQQLKYTGGLSSNISAKGESETAQDFDFKGSLTEKVERIERRQIERDPNTTPQQPSSITATGLFENILVEWTFENANFINSYEVYASQINNFVPNSSNLVWRGKSGAFNYYANVNETWYFRVRGVNSHGVAGPFSEQASATTAMIDGDYIEDATIGMAKIRDINADSIIAGTIRGIEIVGATIISYNSANNDVVTLENGEVLTYVGGKQRLGMHGDGLVAYHWQTEAEVASFRASRIGDELYGADIVGYGDYFSIGRHIGGGTNRHMLHFDWSTLHHKTFLYGGSGEHDSGSLQLYSTSEGGSAGGRVPHLIIENRTTDGTSYSGARFYVGRDNRSPSSANFRSGFEVWQYRGTGDGSSEQLMKIDTDESGETYSQFYTEQLGFFGDRIWVAGDYRSPGDIDIDGGITTGDTSNFYGHLHMRGYNITNVADLQVGRLRAGGSSGRYLALYNGSITTNNNTYEGVILERETGDGGVFFHHDRSGLIGGGPGSYAIFTVGSDSRSALVQSTTIRDRTYTSSANVYVTENGVLGQTSSSRKDKLLIEPMKVNHYNILDITPSDWFDKSGTEAYANYLSNKDTFDLDEEDIPYLRRIPGAVAEDFEDVGLDIYVNYDKDGNVQGLMYDRAWLSLIPIVKDHEQEIIALKDKVSALESEIKQLKGVS